MPATKRVLSRVPAPGVPSGMAGRAARLDGVNLPFDPSLAPGDAIAVFVAARYPATRAGLRALLEGEDGIAVVGDGAVDDPGGEAPFDVLLADLLDGDDAAVAEPYDDTPAVLLGDWDAYLAEPWVAGVARAFLSHEAPGVSIAAAIRAVAAGLTVFDPVVVGRLFDARTDPAVAPIAGFQLTDREQEVLTLVAQGLPNKGIARALGISEHTAKFHVGTILSKLGAASRTEAVTIAVRRGLLAL